MRTRGFTLLEILASLFIFAVMTIGIASTMKQTTSLARRVKSREAKTMSAMIALDRLQRELQMAYHENLQRTATLFKLTDGSSGAELTFSLLDSPINPLIERRSPGVIIVDYRLEKEEKGTFKLLRKEVPYYEKDKLNEATPQVLASGLLQFKLEAYDYRNDRWVKDWDDKGPSTGGYFPKAVRVILEAVDTDLPSEQWKDKSFKVETELMVLNELETR